MNKIRDISDGELMFCDVQELVNSYTIQFLIEFTGNVSIKEIENTINEVVMQNSGINVYKNKNNWVSKNELIVVKNITFEDDTYLLNESFFNETVEFNQRNI